MEKKLIYFEVPYPMEGVSAEELFSKIEYTQHSDGNGNWLYKPIPKSTEFVSENNPLREFIDTSRPPIYLSVWVEKADLNQLAEGVSVEFTKSANIQHVIAEYVNKMHQKGYSILNFAWENRRNESLDFSFASEFIPTKTQGVVYALVTTGDDNPPVNKLFIHNGVFTRRDKNEDVIPHGGQYLFWETVQSNVAELMFFTVLNRDLSRKKLTPKPVSFQDTRCGFSKITGCYAVEEGDIIVKYHSNEAKSSLQFLRITSISGKRACTEHLWVCTEGYWDTPYPPLTARLIWQAISNSVYPLEKNFIQSVMHYTKDWNIV